MTDRKNLIVGELPQETVDALRNSNETEFLKADLERCMSNLTTAEAEIDRLNRHAPRAPQPGDSASQGAVAQVLLDMDYQLCDSMQLAEIMLKYWDVRWKAPVLSSTERGAGK